MERGIEEHDAGIFEKRKPGELLAALCLEGEQAAVVVASDVVVGLCLDESVVHGRWAAQVWERRVGPQPKHEQDDEDDDRVEIVCEDGTAETAAEGVGDDARWEEEEGCVDVHARDGVDGGCSSQQHGAADQDVGSQREEDVGEVRQRPESDADQFEVGVDRRGSALQLDHEGGEEDDLGTVTRSVKHRSRYTVVVSC